MNKVVIVGLSSAIKQVATELRRAYKLKLPDAIVVATAVAINAELLTNDRKLQSVPGVVVRALPLKEALE